MENNAKRDRVLTSASVNPTSVLAAWMIERMAAVIFCRILCVSSLCQRLQQGGCHRGHFCGKCVTLGDVMKPLETPAGGRCGHGDRGAGFLQSLRRQGQVRRERRAHMFSCACARLSSIGRSRRFHYRKVWYIDVYFR